MNSKNYWLESPKFDITLFGGTLLLSAGFIFISSLMTDENKIPIWAFLLLVVCFDAAHVYGTLYRVYMDKEERNRRPKLYYGSIIIIYVLSVVSYIISPILFFRILAYYAVYHFVRQHYGYIALYKYKMNESKKFDLYLDKWTVYIGCLYPKPFDKRRSIFL